MAPLVHHVYRTRPNIRYSFILPIVHFGPSHYIGIRHVSIFYLAGLVLLVFTTKKKPAFTQSEQLFHINLFVREPLIGRLALFFSSSHLQWTKGKRELKHPVCKGHSFHFYCCKLVSTIVVFFVCRRILQKGESSQGSRQVVRSDWQGVLVYKRLQSPPATCLDLTWPAWLGLAANPRMVGNCDCDASALLCQSRQKFDHAGLIRRVVGWRR